MPWRNREISRIEALSDTIFGFSATLLVVSLEVPRTFAELKVELAGFPAFGISFAALLLIWSVHHAFFRRFRAEDPVTLIINGLLLFVVLFYVYPLKFLADAFTTGVLGMGGTPVRMGLQELADLFVLYGLGFIAVFTCVSLLYGNVWKRRLAMELSTTESQESATLFRHYLIFVLVGLISILLARLQIGIRFGLPGIIYGLLGPLCYLHGVWSERRNRSTEADCVQP